MKAICFHEYTYMIYIYIYYSFYVPIQLFYINTVLNLNLFLMVDLMRFYIFHIGSFTHIRKRGFRILGMGIDELF